MLEFWLVIDLAPFQNSTTFQQFFYYIFFIAFVFKVVFIFQEMGYIITEYRNEIKILRKRKSPIPKFHNFRQFFYHIFFIAFVFNFVFYISGKGLQNYGILESKILGFKICSRISGFKILLQSCSCPIERMQTGNSGDECTSQATAD